MFSDPLTAPPPARKDALSVELADIRFGYGRTPLLEGLNFALRRGEIAGLLGPNGCGKTTALRLITGALRPRAGSIHIDGRPRRDYGRRDLARRLALVPQELEVAFDFTVEELVLLGRAPHVGWLRGPTARDRDGALQAMRAVGIDALAARSYRQLSGGERQRVSLAMALAQEPRILLLDEPTHNLDLAQQMAFFTVLRRLTAQRGLTVLAVIHDVNLAALTCDRLMMLQGGRLIADGSPATVVTEDNLRRCYGVEALVRPHPAGGRPQVFLTPGGAVPN